MTEPASASHALSTLRHTAATSCSKRSRVGSEWWSFYTCIVQSSAFELSDPDDSVRLPRLIVAEVPEAQVQPLTRALQSVATKLQKIRHRRQGRRSGLPRA